MGNSWKVGKQLMINVYLIALGVATVGMSVLGLLGLFDSDRGYLNWTQYYYFTTFGATMLGIFVHYWK